MFNIITSKIPTEYKGVKVNTDFKQGLKFFRIVDSEELDQQEKALLIMECLFCSKPPNDADLWNFINFYIGGGTITKNAGGTKTFDFNQDADYIYSAFRQIYNIDLRVISMHWWEFLALFKGLPDGTMLSKIIEIRTKEIDKKMNSKQKAKLMSLKNRYMLKSNQTFKPSF